MAGDQALEAEEGALEVGLEGDDEVRAAVAQGEVEQPSQPQKEGAHRRRDFRGTEGRGVGQVDVHNSFIYHHIC